MNRNQREDLAKVLYDLAKIAFAGLVITNISDRDKFNVNVFLIGLVGTVLPVVAGLLLRRNKRR